MRESMWMSVESFAKMDLPCVSYVDIDFVT